MYRVTWVSRERKIVNFDKIYSRLQKDEGQKGCVAALTSSYNNKIRAGRRGVVGEGVCVAGMLCGSSVHLYFQFNTETTNINH